jgi:hypothetical protein
MLEVLPAVANTVNHDLVGVADGLPITSGTVNFYLKATSGTHAGNWFKSDGTWHADEQVAAVGTHETATASTQRWYASIAAAAWVEGTRYVLEAHESGGLDVQYSQDVICRTLSVALAGSGIYTKVYTVTSSSTGLPIAGVYVRVTTDVAGFNTIAVGHTNISGQVTFYLDAGTYYLWRTHALYVFTDPDMEVAP